MPKPPSPPVQPPGGPTRWTVPDELGRRPLDGVLRALGGLSWADARRLVQTGKVTISGELCTEPTRRVRAGDPIVIDVRAPRPRVARVRDAARDLIVFVDASVVVVRKPADISTVPFGDGGPDDRDTLDALVRDVVARRDRVRGRAPLGVVQRLDKQTSGLIVFARSVAAKQELSQQLRQRTMKRSYLAIAHGEVPAATHRSLLVPDRGDGLRGSQPTGVARGQRTERGADGGAARQLAVTHVEPIERLGGATLVRCRLETGRTHQIRIHLSEAGHPVVGEKVYVRRYRGSLIPAPRLMLHAAELGFEHPRDGRPMLFEEPPPEDFTQTLERLRVR